MNEFQREVLTQIKRGIDRARHEGVIVEYPRGALIDGAWVQWPFDGLSPTVSPPLAKTIAEVERDVEQMCGTGPTNGNGT